MAGKYKVLQMSKGDLDQRTARSQATCGINGQRWHSKLQVTPPNHLDPVAKQEYKRIIESLGPYHFRNLDRAELENYCTWYSVYKTHRST